MILTSEQQEELNLLCAGVRTVDISNQGLLPCWAWLHPVFPGLEESLLHPVFHFSGGELGWSHWLGRDHVGTMISVAGTNRLSSRHWMTNTNRLDTVLCPATCLLQLYCCCSHILVSAVCSSHQLTTL